MHFVELHTHAIGLAPIELAVSRDFVAPACTEMERSDEDGHLKFYGGILWPEHAFVTSCRQSHGKGWYRHPIGSSRCPEPRL